ANTRPEDGDSEEGRTAVIHEDVYGLSSLLHLPHEVSIFVASAPG
ncbi:unnamed protein product, partial [Tetraodon nigroviridis]